MNEATADRNSDGHGKIDAAKTERRLGRTGRRFDRAKALLTVPVAVAALLAAGACTSTGPTDAHAGTPKTTGTPRTTIVAPSTTMVSPSTTMVSSADDLGPTHVAHPTAGSCDVHGDPNDSTSTWTDLIHSHDLTVVNQLYTVPGPLGITDTDILRIVYDVDLYNWQASSSASYFVAHLFPDGAGSANNTNIIYEAGPAVPNPPGITSGAQLLPLPPLPAGFGFFTLQLDVQDTGWDFTIQRCDDSAPDGW